MKHRKHLRMIVKQVALQCVLGAACTPYFCGTSLELDTTFRSGFLAGGGNISFTLVSEKEENNRRGLP